jgi:hypothetical protein
LNILAASNRTWSSSRNTNRMLARSERIMLPVPFDARNLYGESTFSNPLHEDASKPHYWNCCLTWLNCPLFEKRYNLAASNACNFSKHQILPQWRGLHGDVMLINTVQSLLKGTALY